MIVSEKGYIGKIREDITQPISMDFLGSKLT